MLDVYVPLVATRFLVVSVYSSPHTSVTLPPASRTNSTPAAAAKSQAIDVSTGCQLRVNIRERGTKGEWCIRETLRR